MLRSQAALVFTLKWNGSLHLQPQPLSNMLESVIRAWFTFEIRYFSRRRLGKRAGNGCSRNKRSAKHLDLSMKMTVFPERQRENPVPSLSTGVLIVPKSPAPVSVSACAKNWLLKGFVREVFGRLLKNPLRCSKCPWSPRFILRPRYVWCHINEQDMLN